MPFSLFHPIETYVRPTATFNFRVFFSRPFRKPTDGPSKQSSASGHLLYVAPSITAGLPCGNLSFGAYFILCSRSGRRSEVRGVNP